MPIKDGIFSGNRDEWYAFYNGLRDMPLPGLRDIAYKIWYYWNDQKISEIALREHEIGIINAD